MTALPKTQIAVMGMERMVPTMEEFDVLVSLLLCRSAVGQRINKLCNGTYGPDSRGRGRLDRRVSFSDC